VIEPNLKNIENQISENQPEINENSNEIEEGEIIENEENNNIATAEEDEIKFLNEFKRRIKMEENNACDHSNDTTDLSVTTRKGNQKKLFKLISLERHISKLILYTDQCSSDHCFKLSDWPNSCLVQQLI